MTALFALCYAIENQSSTKNRCLMNKEDAKALVRNLIDVAYEAGVQHNSQKTWNSRKNALELGDEIIRHLTSHLGKAADACACNDGGLFDFGNNNICINCGGTVPPPAYVDSMDNKVIVEEVDE